MRLMQRLKDELKQLGPLKRVWLTSFDINIPFIEGQLLPALLGEDPPRDRLAYEALQLALSQQQIDFRIFCDRRALEADQFKRTAIRIYPVEVRTFTELAGITERSLFHPKVIYLEDTDGKAVLGAGSANLTVSGWGRNREVFDFRPVSSVTQQQQIRRFFSSLDSALELPEMPRLAGNDPHWQFAHSFEPQTFLHNLAGGDTVERLTVWSPYLAKDLPAFIGRLQRKLGNPDLKLALVPDRIEGHKIRTPWSEALGTLLDSGALSFHDYPVPPPADIEFTHAKLWLAETASHATLAIGSWNFTHPGTSSFADPDEDGGGINIEAGILHRCKTPPAVAGAAPQPGPHHFASDAELEDSELDVEPAPPFDLLVYFDWWNSSYQISGRWYMGAPEHGCLLHLPGLKTPLDLSWNQDNTLQPLELAVKDSAALLAQHFYRVEIPEGAPSHGLIIETGQRYRRAQSFETLKDLFDNLVTNTDPESNGMLVLHPNLRTGDDLDEDLPLSADEGRTEELTYFRLFFAMKQFRTRLEACDEPAQLVNWLRVYPGCLQELAEKVRIRQQQHKTVVIDWFLAQEVNASCRFAGERLAMLADGAEARYISEAQWASLEVAVPQLKPSNRDQRKFIDYIASASGYEEVGND